MAERRNSGILKTLFLWSSILPILISGCRTSSSVPPATVYAAQEVPAPSTITAPTATDEQFNLSHLPTATLDPTSISADILPASATELPDTPNSPPVTPESSVTPRSFATIDGVLATPPIPVPSPAIPFPKREEVVNILLLGNDVRWAQGGRTDSILLISINRESGKVKILSIPRDLFVVIPGWQMNRINLALPHGHGTEYPGGGGALMKDTILYNLGIPVDYYMRIGFSGFKEIVDRLGGIEVVVNCPVEDWRLRDPSLDPEIEENWEPFLLSPGVQRMDGEMALWYVRSRHNSNDIDRGRRQQKIVRALLQQANSVETVLEIPLIWHDYSDMFETDLLLEDFLELAAVVPRIEEIDHLLLGGRSLQSWKVPNTGEAVQLLDREAVQPLLRQFSGESTLHGASRAPVKVEVETNDPIMYRQAAENLLWFGFEPVLKYRDEPDPLQTSIVLWGGSIKGAFISRLAAVFRQNVDDIVWIEDDDTALAVYHIDLGQSYNPCLPYLELGYPAP